MRSPNSSKKGVARTNRKPKEPVWSLKLRKIHISAYLAPHWIPSWKCFENKAGSIMNSFLEIFRASRTIQNNISKRLLLLQKSSSQQYRKRKIILELVSSSSILCDWSLSIAPENIKKPLALWHLQGYDTFRAYRQTPVAWNGLKYAGSLIQQNLLDQILFSHITEICKTQFVKKSTWAQNSSS